MSSVHVSPSKSCSKPFWASDLRLFGLNYYSGIVENAEELLESHKVATQSSFGTRSSVQMRDTPGLVSTGDPDLTKEKISKVYIAIFINILANFYIVEKNKILLEQVNKWPEC